MFISYAAAEREIAERVCGSLEKRGAACWIAPRDVVPGTAYAAQIVRAIQTASSMVLVFSAKANASAHVAIEVERAVSFGVRMFPLRIEDVELSHELQYYLSRPHWVDAFGGDVDPAMSRLQEHVMVAKSEWTLAHPETVLLEQPPAAPPKSAPTEEPGPSTFNRGPVPATGRGEAKVAGTQADIIEGKNRGGRTRWKALAAVLLIGAGSVGALAYVEGVRKFFGHSPSLSPSEIAAAAAAAAAAASQ